MFFFFFGEEYRCDFFSSLRKEYRCDLKQTKTTNMINYLALTGHWESDNYGVSNYLNKSCSNNYFELDSHLTHPLLGPRGGKVKNHYKNCGYMVTTSTSLTFFLSK